MLKTFINIVLYLLGAISIALVSCQEYSVEYHDSINMGNLEMNKIITNIAITVDSTILMVTLSVANNSSDPMYLEKSKVFADGKIANHLFKFTSQGKKVHYIGIMAKLGEPQLEDFIKLKPGEHFENTVELTESYEFLAGKHEYQGVYKAYHSIPNTDDYWKLQSNTVNFTFPD